MTAAAADMDARAAGLGLFEKWLSVWVALAIAAGLILGNTLPGLFEVLAGFEVASVNLVVAVLIWAMVYPMMVAVDFGAVRRVGDKPKGLIITLVVNWFIKPFTMAALGVLFFEVVFADHLPAREVVKVRLDPRSAAAVHPHLMVSLLVRHRRRERARR
jgi:ACR3 family arsenite transporter